MGEVLHGQKLWPHARLSDREFAAGSELPPFATAFMRSASRSAMRFMTESPVLAAARRLDNGQPLLEAYLFDFSGDLYGQTIEVFFIGWIREE